MEKEKTVFISYAKEDRVVAEQIYNQLKKLKKHKIKPWIDIKDMIAGQNWKSVITETIEQSSFFIALLSSKSLTKRGFVQKELKIALDVLDTVPPEQIYIIPVRIDECQISDEKLKLIQWCDLFESYENGLYEIFRGLGINIKKEQVMLENNPFSFSRWPKPFINDNGDIDGIIVIGHSDKESPPTDEELEAFDLYIESDEWKMPQSLRPAEYLPYLITYLSNESIKEKICLGKKDDILVNSIECHIDWHLFKFRKELIKNNNIISLGAGDTNWFTRWVLAYYQKYLPIRFHTPEGSQTILCNNIGKLDAFSIRQVENNLDKNGAVLLLFPNPLNRDKAIIVAAGLTALGTQAAILALSKPNDELLTTDSVYPGNYARVLKGIEDNWRAIDYKIIR